MPAVVLKNEQPNHQRRRRNRQRQRDPIRILHAAVHGIPQQGKRDRRVQKLKQTSFYIGTDVRVQGRMRRFDVGKGVSMNQDLSPIGLQVHVLDLLTK